MEYRKTRKPLIMKRGERYTMTTGSEIECLAFRKGDKWDVSTGIIRMLSSGWTVKIFGPGVYVDGKIDWNYSGREYGFLTHAEAVRRCRL